MRKVFVIERKTRRNDSKWQPVEPWYAESDRDRSFDFWIRNPRNGSKYRKVTYMPTEEIETEQPKEIKKITLEKLTEKWLQGKYKFAIMYNSGDHIKCGTAINTDVIGALLEFSALHPIESVVSVVLIGKAN